MLNCAADRARLLGFVVRPFFEAAISNNSSCAFFCQLNATGDVCEAGHIAPSSPVKGLDKIPRTVKETGNSSALPLIVRCL